MIKIADGRTRICGRREESIFLRSRGRRPYCPICQHACPPSEIRLIEHTLAISSDFLNSPSMNVTFPFSSNSVHRNFNSFAPLTVFLRPKFVLPESSKKPGSAGEPLDFEAVFSLRHLSFHGLFHSGRVSVDAYREGFVLSGGEPKSAGGFLAKAENLDDPRSGYGLRKSRLRRDDSTEACRGKSVAKCLLAEGRACATFPRDACAPRHEEFWLAVALVLGVKKQTCSDWDRRKRRTDEEGADTVGLGTGLISSGNHGAISLVWLLIEKKRSCRKENYCQVGRVRRSTKPGYMTRYKFFYWTCTAVSKNLHLHFSSSSSSWNWSLANISAEVLRLDKSCTLIDHIQTKTGPIMLCKSSQSSSLPVVLLVFFIVCAGGSQKWQCLT